MPDKNALRAGASPDMHFHYTTHHAFLQPFIKKGYPPLQSESLFTKNPSTNGKYTTFCIKPVDSLHGLCYNIGTKSEIPAYYESQVQSLCKTKK